MGVVQEGTVSTTTQEFLDHLAQCGLMSESDISALRAESAQELDRTCMPLAQRLVREGRLTDYQAATLGRGDLTHVVFGDYVAVEQVGQGGMAVVYRAVHRTSGETVAIKLLETEDPEAASRFDREVRAASKVSHPNIVTAYDSVHHEDQNFLVMEYVDGPTLQKLVEEEGPLPWDEVVNYIAQAALGLEHAHSRLIVHRDIKPDNLLLGSDGTVKILDLGLVRLDHAPRIDRRPSQNDRLTQMGTMLGTVDYMPPEQGSDPRLADYRSDIYSLGCTMYYLLYGEAPYSRDTTMGTLMAHQTDPIPDLTQLVPGVPPELQDVFEKMVAKDPYDRYQEMPELLFDLRHFFSEEDWLAIGGSEPAPPTGPVSRSRQSSANASRSSSVYRPPRTPTGKAPKSQGMFESGRAATVYRPKTSAVNEPARRGRTYQRSNSFLGLLIGAIFGGLVGYFSAFWSLPFALSIAKMVMVVPIFGGDSTLALAVTGTVIGGLLGFLISEIFGGTK